MQKLVRSLFMGLVLVLPMYCYADGSEKLAKETVSLGDIPKLANEDQHPIACRRIYRDLTETHYRKDVAIDDHFIHDFYLEYFKYIDPYKSLFFKSEIDEFISDIGNVRESVIRCKLDLPYKIFNRYAMHKFDQMTYAINLLESGKLDLNQDQDFAYDRDKAEWSEDPKQRNELWEKIVKYDLIKIILSGKDQEKASKQLIKRYKSNLNFLTQLKSEDAFSAFENSLAHQFDPHTTYMSPIASEEFFADMHLSLEGIGATLKSEDDTVTIEELIPGGPAEKSNLLKPKDRIIGVGSSKDKITDLVGMRLDEAVKLIRGPKDSKVYLQIQRGDGAASKIFIISLIRDKIKLTDRAASSEIIEIDHHKVGVLKASSFYENLTQDARKELEKLKKENIEALVVDLRNNGGGLITEAAGFTGLFVEKGPIVQVRDMNNFIETVDDPSSDVMYDGPMVVLINSLSASASEIFAAALQDYGRALIVGSNSFGKGTVQQVMPLGKFYDLFSSQLGQLSYTIAKFYRINGGSTQLKGVAPDLPMPSVSDVSKYAEKELDNALPWDSIKSQKYNQLNNFSQYIQPLKEKLDQRIAKDPAYKITLEQIEDAKAIMDQKTVSLNLKVRQEEKERDSKKELDRTNALLKIIGQEPVKDVNDVPAKTKFPDVQKDQAAHVALDFALLSASSKK